MTSPELPATIEELIASAQGAEREGRRADARALYERALYSLDARSAGVASSLLRWIGRTHQVDADPQAALDCIEAAIAIAELAGDHGAMGHAINIQAIVHWQQGELDAAECLYTQAREHALRAGELRLAAMTAGNLGVIANIRGDLERTRRFYTTSLDEFRAVGQPQEICAALNNMGMLYADQGDWAAAEQAYDEGIQIATVLGDIGALIMLDGNRAEMFLDRGDLPRARAAAEKAALLSRQTNDRRALGEIHKHLGAIAREEANLEEAQEHLARAKELAEERHDLLLLAETSREQAELFRGQGRNREALTHLNRAHRLFEQLRAKRDLADIGKRTRRLEGHFLEVIRHWGESIESKDRYTKGHCDRVADLSCALAALAGLDARELFFFRIGALVHDVGKLVIPSEVLNKPGPLTSDEWELVRRHPVAGVEMVSEIEFPDQVLEIVRSHHERWDGRGYPDGLVAEAIPRSARILCIADVYDALTSMRSYKAAMSPAEALDVMRRDVGRQFDPELFEHFEELMRTRQTPARTRQAPILRRDGVTDTISAARGARDDLTGVLLRRSFVEAATAMLVEREAEESVSFLVIDLDEFKAVNDTYGHLQGDDVLRTVAQTLRDTVGAAGLLGRYAGDEFVAVLPRSTMPEAEQMGEALRAAVRELAIPLRERAGAMSVTLSIGVSTSEGARDQFEALFARADRALYEAKRRGRDAVVTSTAVEGAAPEPAIHLRHFVGREVESKRMVRLLESTIGHGVTSAVAIVGEAGVGKSTLVRQLLPEVRLRAGSLVAGRCVEADVKPPYAAWAEVIAAIHKLGIVAGREWHELPRLVPALGSASDDRGSGNKYMLFDEIASYLRAASSTRPLVVMLDDMQWADASTWDVLEHVFAQLEDDRLLLCLTIRLEDERGDALERRRRLSRDERFQELHLQRLTIEELETWLGQVFVGSAVSADLLPFLHEYSEGNPLLATQLLRMLLDDGAIRQVGGTWQLRAPQEVLLPAAITGLMERRLARLSPRTRQILTTAAVIGREFDIDVLAAAEGCNEDELLDALEEGEGVAVLEQTREDNASASTFAHSLLVQAALRSVNGRRVARVHERVARALEEHRPDSLADIARHFDRAGNGAQAYRYAVRAGKASVSVYAYEEARRFFAMAERCAQTASERGQAMLHLVEVAEAEGHYADGEALCERALGESQEPVPPAQSLPLRRLRERLRSLQGQQPRRTIFACRALLAEAATHGLQSEVVALLSLISQSHTRLAEWPEAESVARDCVAAAERSGDNRLVAEALTRLGTALMDSRPAEATELYDRAHQLFAGLGDRGGQARCLINLGIVHSRLRHATEAEAAYARALTTAREARAGDLVALASLNLGVLHVRRGQANLADDAFREALKLFTQMNSEPLRLATLYNLAHLDRERGRHTQAIALYDDVIAIAARTGQPDVELGARAGMALAFLAIGRVSDSRAAAETIEKQLEKTTEWWIQGREIVDALRVRLALQRDELAQAQTIFRDGVTIAAKHDPYAAAWFVAECAPELQLPAEDLTAIVQPHAHEAKEQGFGALVARFAAIMSGESGGGSFAAA